MAAMSRSTRMLLQQREEFGAQLGERGRSRRNSGHRIPAVANETKRSPAMIT